MKKNCLLLFFVMVIIITINAQTYIEKRIDQLDAYLFSIVDQQDTIQFIKVNTDLQTPKPTILFCQGSLPRPLVADYDGDLFLTTLSNFDYQKISEKYNFVMISMPFVPAIVLSSQLNQRHHAYITDLSDENSYPVKYEEANYLDKYVERGNVVLDFLREQMWVDRNQIILLGHSQGARIAASLAEKNPDIYAMGYFCGSVLGRYQSFILRERNYAKKGKISIEEAQANIEERYKWWQNVCRDTTEFVSGDLKRAWKSFSILDIKLITESKMPIFITYGTEDDGSQMCDILPIFFELAGKTNYKMRPFVGCGHNFEEITLDGNSNWDKMHWEDAVNEFILWIESLK
jgi:pimeloyl-ACP methyl ester carboxylesterase